MSRPAISYPIPRTSDDGPARPSHLDYAPYRDPVPQSLRGLGGNARGQTAALDSHITRLLVLTKQLLQGLEQWSHGAVSEETVSDVFVRLGNGFEQCVNMFRQEGISSEDLASVPDDLRAILERALAENPSQDTLNTYLPDIRAIIFNLLNGLKNKQIAFKRAVADRQQGVRDLSSPSLMELPSPRNPSRPGPSSDADMRSIRSVTSDGATSPQSMHSHLPHTRQAPPPVALAERGQQRTTRPAPPDAFRPTRTRPSGERPQRVDSRGEPRPDSRSDSRGSNNGAPLAQVESRGHLDSRVQAPPPIPMPQAQPHPSSSRGPPPPRPQPHPDRLSRESTNHITSRFSADSDISVASSRRPQSDVPPPPPVTPPAAPPPAAPSSPPPKGSHMTFGPGFLPPVPSDPPVPPAAPPPPTLPMPDVFGQPVMPTLQLPASPGNIAADEIHPIARSSLALLQSRDALERRASKRFSSYTFNRMLPHSPSAKKIPSGGDSPPRPARRERIPAMPALHEDMVSNRGSVIERVTSAEASVGSVSGTSPSLGALSSSFPLSSSPHLSEPSRSEASSATAEAPAIPPPTSSVITVYLQLGRHVKKASIEMPITMSALRLLFMERFEYDPGMEDFPDVCIKESPNAVQYELENMDDVKAGCILSLDIEALEQIKQHFDLTFATLAQDIKELKTAFTQAKRQSTHVPPAALLSISPTNQPSPLSPDLSAVRQPPQRTASGRISLQPNLQVHHDEVQILRRDLAILRQLHIDFLSQTKESFAALRAQNTAMREVVKTKMGGNRALLDNSKAKLDAQCQDTIQAVEEVSDTIDTAREDVLKRGVTPSRTLMEKISGDLKRATEMVETFASDVTLAEPTWRATWLAELKRVTEEQRQLGHQNRLTQDLRNDIKDAKEMLDNVQLFVDQRAAGTVRRGFQPPPPEEKSGGISNLLLEIRTKEADPTQRLRAIEEQQKAREREKAAQTDEFQDELSGFVNGRRLRKTGGTDEADRIRQRRQDQTLRRMLTGDLPSSPPGVLSPQGTGGKSPRALANSVDIPEMKV